MYIAIYILPHSCFVLTALLQRMRGPDNVLCCTSTHLESFFFSFFLLAATSRCKRTSSVINLPHLQQVVAYKLQQNLNFKFYDHNWFIHLFFVNLFVHFTLLLIIFHFCKLAAYKQKYEKKMISSRSLPLIEYNKISSSFWSPVENCLIFSVSTEENDFFLIVCSL